MKNMIQSKRVSNRVKGGLILGLILCFCAHDTKGSGDSISLTKDAAARNYSYARGLQPPRHRSIKSFPDNFGKRIVLSGDESFYNPDESFYNPDESVIKTIAANIAKRAQDKVRMLSRWFIWDDVQ